VRDYKDMETIEFITPVGTAMFPWIFEKNPEADEQGKTWFGITLRFPKDEMEGDEDFIAMRRQFMRAAKEGWPKGNDPDNPGKFDSEFGSPLRDGDKFDKANNKKRREELFGHWYISFKSKDRPGFCGVNKSGELVDLISKEDAYPGMGCAVSGVAFPYDNKGNQGVGVRLTNICKLKDGERIGGKPAAKEQFAKFGKSSGPSRNDSDTDDLL
jgi:hypothetical protein